MLCKNAGKSADNALFEKLLQRPCRCNATQEKTAPDEERCFFCSEFVYTVRVLLSTVVTCVVTVVFVGTQIVGKHCVRFYVVDDFLQFGNYIVGVVDVPQHLRFTLAGNVNVPHMKHFVGEPTLRFTPKTSV